MRPFRKPATQTKTAAPKTERRSVRACFACHRQRPPYLYAENGHDYCIPCAADSYALFGLRPAGRRPDDVTLDDLSCD